MTIQLSNISRHPHEASGYWLRRMGLGWLLSLLIASMLSSGCAFPRVKVLTGDESVRFLKAGSQVTATNNCYLVSEPMMKRILRDVQDAMLKERTAPAAGSAGASPHP